MLENDDNTKVVEPSGELFRENSSKYGRKLRVYMMKKKFKWKLLLLDFNYPIRTYKLIECSVLQYFLKSIYSIGLNHEFV